MSRERPIERATRGRLMVVDGSETGRAAMSRYFVARGWDVIAIADGVEAVTQGLAQHVDVAVMNVTLPGIEGVEAAAILRRLDPRMRIILTAEPDAETRPPEREHTECFRCFPKPLDLDAVARAIDDGGDAGTEEGER